MKALWGTISLLVALALVGLVTARQLRSVGRVPQTSPEGVAVLPAPRASGNAAESARAIERRIADDVARSLRQGADARASAPDAP